MSSVIGQSVKEKCGEVMGAYEGDCVEVLIAVVANEEENFHRRNYAIWALGQLGDGRALPLLRSMYTGRIPKRELYDAGITQYELKKAISLLEGEFNATAWVWRHGRLE